MTHSLRQKTDKDVQADFISLVDEIQADMIQQPVNRKQEGFYTTKNLFLEKGLTQKDHKLWRDNGMHRHMRIALLDQYNNLNPASQLVDIGHVLANTGRQVTFRYPDISWEDLECHAAMIRITELRDSDTPEDRQANKKTSIVMTLEQLVTHDLRNMPGYTPDQVRSSLLRQCSRRKATITNKKQTLPQPLYINGRKFKNVEIIRLSSDVDACGYLFQINKD